jgi:hypothetical protein
MAKLFEVAVHGAAPIVDSSADLQSLGFLHLKNALIYETFSEAAELVAWARRNPAHLHEIAQQAQHLALARHSWGHRMPMIERIFSDRLRRT